MDLESVNRDKLRAVFPECFTEGRLDIDKLLSLCGEYITDDFEKYEFKWKGKSDCLRLAQKRSTATLRPVPGDSVNWDTTQNLYIEGDNLEVLKLRTLNTGAELYGPVSDWKAFKINHA